MTKSPDVQLTKTDFKEYLLCPKCLWVKKRKPELYTQGEFSLFLQKLIKDGYAVERYVQERFPSGVSVGGSNETATQKTQELLAEKKTMFQATFQTLEGLFVKLDVLAFNTETQQWDIYEVKSSSEIKTDVKHNHIKDITFQTIVTEKCGVDVGRSYIVHINKDYVRKGDIDLYQLCTFADVTEEVEGEKAVVTQEIQEALGLLSRDDISMHECSCLYKSRGQHCDCFSLFNPKVPEYSVHDIFRGSKLQLLIHDNIFDIKDIPDDFDLTDAQAEKVTLQKTEKEIIDYDAIEETVAGLQYPIYFLDYETLGSPIPPLDGYKTNQQLVFQYSLHKMDEDGTVEHYEYLADDLENATARLVASLKENIGSVGSVLVWYEAFEKGRNTELGKLHPEYRAFMEDLNNRIYDLMKVYKKHYLHPEFRGSASIKKVLPVMLPELSYKALAIQDGTMALSEWEHMVSSELSDTERAETRKNLLAYCELDTLAMVELFKKVKDL